MASAPCHIIELPTAVLLLIADATSHRHDHRSVGRLACAGKSFVLGPTSCQPSRKAYSIRCSHGTSVSAWRHAMLFNGPWPFQAAGRHACCTGCGTVIRATVEYEYKYRVVLFADMLRHVQMEHAA